MDFRKRLEKRTARRVEFTFDYYLKNYLQRPSEESMKLLAMLALDDIEYCKNIAKVIEYRVSKVDDASKLYAIYLIDTIVQTVGGEIYRTLLSEKVSQLFSDILQIATVKVREILYKTRQTWKGVFPYNILKKIDAKLQERVSQLDLLRMEISLLERKQNSPELCASKKRCRTEVLENFSKKRNVIQSEESASFASEIERNSLSPRSSVLLTPPSETEVFDTDSFWSNIREIVRKTNTGIEA